MKRIMIVANASSTHTIRWANALYEKGHAVTLVTQHTPISGLKKEIPLITLPYEGMKGYFLNTQELRRLNLKIKPDVIHAYFASGYGTLLANTGLNYYISVWGSDVYIYPKKNLINKLLLRRSLEKATYIFSTSEAMKVEALNYTSKPIYVIPFGVDVRKYDKEFVVSNQITIGVAKVLDEIYGIDILVKAFSKVKKASSKDVRLRIAGDGPSRQALEKLANKLGVAESVEFLGWLDFDCIAEFYKSLDIFCVPSYSESFGVVAVEAGAASLPSVVSDVGGLPEVVRNNETGYVVPAGDVEAFADKILILAEDESLRNKLGKAARERVESNYQWKINVDDMSKYYEN